MIRSIKVPTSTRWSCLIQGIGWETDHWRDCLSSLFWSLRLLKSHRLLFLALRHPLRQGFAVQEDFGAINVAKKYWPIKILDALDFCEVGRIRTAGLLAVFVRWSYYCVLGGDRTAGLLGEELARQLFSNNTVTKIFFLRFLLIQARNSLALNYDA